MTIKEKITTDMKTAMKSGDKTRLGVLRMLRSKIQEAEVQERAKEGVDYSLDDDRTIHVIASYAKQRRESIESYRQGGRDDLVAKEEAELAAIQEYLPEQLSEEEIRKIVADAIAESSASSIKDMGAVMKLLMPQVKGRADGKQVNEIVREMLGAGEQG